MEFPKRRPYAAFLALGIVFVSLAAAGRSPLYYAVATLFFAVAIINKRQLKKQ